jgi:hypothetical protein
VAPVKATAIEDGRAILQGVTAPSGAQREGAHIVKNPIHSFVAVAFYSVGLLVCASCGSESKPAPTANAPVAQSQVTTPTGGQAGRLEEDVFRVQAVISAVDMNTRRVTLTGPEGRSYTFTAGPEIKNLAQTRVGDKVSATFARRLLITVRRDDAPPGETYDTTSATARLGEKPGMLVAEEVKITARVKSINASTRTAELEFSDGSVAAVTARPDVDLSKYTVGDNVVIRSTTTLTVLAETPG